LELLKADTNPDSRGHYIIMIKQLLPGIYQLKVPLPRNPLKAINSYLIGGQARSLLVDTGFNWPECKEALLKGIETLGVDWAEIDFFVTHLHGDHFGLVYDLARQESVVYCSEVDANIIKANRSTAYWKEINSFYLMHGYPPHELDQGDTLRSYVSGTDINFKYVNEGDCLEYGGYHLVCISTPGHTPGHMCLYEPERKFLISGDHILADITSNITGRPGWNDSLGQYLKSLEKINAMDINLVLPGHRSIIRNHHRRIEELKLHHKKRLEEVQTILQDGPMSAYQVASLMHWDLTYDSWEQIPSFQKWFATGEAIAHLEHLVHVNVLRKIEQDGGVIYALPD